MTTGDVPAPRAGAKIDMKKLHQIYLSDPRRTAPEKLLTVIRQSMTRGD